MSDDLDYDMEVVGKGETDLRNKTEVTSSESEPSKSSRDGTSSDQDQKRQSFLVGDLPIDWKAERLERVCDINPDSFSPDDENGTFEYISLSNVSEGIVLDSESVSIEEAPSRATRRVKEGDVLVGTVRPKQSSHGFVTEEHGGKVCSSGFGVLRTGKSVNSQFLRQEVLSHRFFRQMMAYVAGSGYPAVKLSDLRKHRIAVPPLPEQRKIASVLYTVDQAIQKTEAIIEQAQRVKRGLMQDLLTFGITEEGDIRNPEEAPGEFRETALGKVPREWRMMPLREVCHEIVDSPHSTPEYAEEGVLIVRTSDIDEGRFVPDEAKRVTEEAYRERISRLKPEPGDVVFTREAPVGEAFRIPERTRLCLGQRTMVLRSREDVLNPEFLVHSIYSYRIQKRFDQLVVGTTNPHLNVGTIRNFKIPIPDLDEQNRIVSVLSSVDNEIDVGLQRRNRLSQLKKGLMQDLLTGEVRTADKAIEVLEEVEAHG